MSGSIFGADSSGLGSLNALFNQPSANTQSFPAAQTNTLAPTAAPAAPLDPDHTPDPTTGLTPLQLKAIQGMQAQTPLDATNTWAAAQNKNAYGTDNPQNLGQLGQLGFPLMNDPRLIQGHLADMLQGNVPLPPGMSMQSVQDEFQRQMQQANNNRGAGGAG